MADIRNSIATSHTPGPWALNDDDLSASADVGAHICQVADVDNFPCVDPDEVDTDAVQVECLANGRLIAAAPDLLARLKHLVRWHDQIRPEDIKQAEAAIAKAEGRS